MLTCGVACQGAEAVLAYVVPICGGIGHDPSTGFNLRLSNSGHSVPESCLAKVPIMFYRMLHIVRGGLTDERKPDEILADFLHWWQIVETLQAGDEEGA